MGACVIVQSLLPFSSCSPKCCKTQTLALSPPQFLSSRSLSLLKKQIFLPNARFKGMWTPKSRSLPGIFAVQSNVLRALQTVWKVGRDGIEAGANLVPDSVPRPVARISVTVVALAVTLFVLKSLLSTVFFVLATMGLVYFIFIALNKDEGPKGGGGTSTTEDSLEEARRIMEKYK